MGIKARNTGNTTNPQHNINQPTTRNTAPSSAGDTTPASTITDLQDSIHNLPGTGTNNIRSFTKTAPNTTAAKTDDAWIKHSQFPSNTKQHFMMLQARKQYHLACRWRWRQKRGNSTSCCCPRSHISDILRCLDTLTDRHSFQVQHSSQVVCCTLFCFHPCVWSHSTWDQQ